MAPRQYDGPIFRADAKAEGQQVVIGGWECRDGCPVAAARWFRIELTRKTAPWAFGRGEPFRAIAALELFASLVSLMVFAQGLPDDAGAELQLSGLTDNSGNTFALARLMSSKFPLVVILAEVAAQLRKRRLALELQWVPRNQNEEADALTNNRTELFDKAREIKIDLAKLEFIVLPEMVKVADALYAEVRRRRSSRKDQGSDQRTRKRGRPLRERDPW